MIKKVYLDTFDENEMVSQSPLIASWGLEGMLFSAASSTEVRVHNILEMRSRILLTF